MKFAYIALIAANSAIQINETVTVEKRKVCITRDQSNKVYSTIDTNNSRHLQQEELAAAIENHFGFPGEKESAAEASANAAIVLKKYGVKKNKKNKSTDLNKWQFWKFYNKWVQTNAPSQCGQQSSITPATPAPTPATPTITPPTPAPTPAAPAITPPTPAIKPAAPAITPPKPALPATPVKSPWVNTCGVFDDQTAKIFDCLDTNHDGALDLDELKAGFEGPLIGKNNMSADDAQTNASNALSIVGQNLTKQEFYQWFNDYNQSQIMKHEYKTPCQSMQWQFAIYADCSTKVLNMYQ